MNIKKILNKSETFLQKHNIDQARLDAEVLLADLLDMERIKLYVNYDYPLTKQELNQYRSRIMKRAEKIPVAYIIGHQEFMSLDLKVNQNVLIPRPETEILVEEIISRCQKQELKQPNIVDVGTGSGAIMVSLGYNLTKSKILGIDVSEKILKVAQTNIKKYELGDRLKVIKGNLLQPLLKMNKTNVDIVVSNPPYIGEDEMKNLPPDVKNEPQTALNGGKQGLEIYKELIPQAAQVLKKDGLLALEIGFNQADEIINLLENNWQDIQVKRDYTDQDNMILAKKGKNYKSED